LLHMILKMTPKWAWPGQQTIEMMGPHITGKTSKVNYININSNKTANIKGKVYNDV